MNVLAAIEAIREKFIESQKKLHSAHEVLREFVDERHVPMPKGGLCERCGLRWPCPNEQARRVVEGEIR